MKDKAFWQQKIIQFFHDPPAKPFTGTPKTGKHTIVARDLFDAFQRLNEGRPLRHWYKSADWAATGADRPLMDTCKKRGSSPLGTVRWPAEPIITHPLSPGCHLYLSGQAGVQEKNIDEEELEGEDRDLILEQTEVAEEMSSLIPDWTDQDVLKKGFIFLWRQFREALISNNPRDPLWQELPTDSRYPDHSIWDHLKVTTALAFMKPHRMRDEIKDEGAREPWMLRVSLGPVQDFISHARTSRDLWIGSFLLADLSWHAMQPIAERYGPDCIVYPDLNANPRADCWLFERYRDAWGENARPSTFAAVLPGSFVALVPRGGEEHLLRLEDLCREVREGVSRRWDALAGTVRAWIATEIKPGGGGWETIWERQHRQCPIHVTWVAVPWRPMERLNCADSLRGRPLPVQKEGHREIDPADQAAIDKRQSRLAPWVSTEVWSHYELAREVYARSYLEYHQMERGFDYALTHHQLRLRHDLRKGTSPAAHQADEPGEKCTLCGQREALHDGSGNLPLGEQRSLARAFWRHEKLDPDKTGAERLCAVCAVKRFLVDADQAGALFNKLWTGPAEEDIKEARDQDGRLRVPFPSTATFSAQSFLAGLVRDDRYIAEMRAVVDACKTAGLPRTSFPRALPQLAAAIAGKPPGAAREILTYEAQDVLFPEVLDGKIRSIESRIAGLERRGDAQREQELHRKANGLRALRQAVSALRRKVQDNKERGPGTSLAVIRLDGDRMGRLLLGDPGAIATRWRDVLHPEVLRRFRERETLSLRETGWPDLLDSKRLMGPSLHAFVSRALGYFSHRIVPWVVEREFSGRLIYAGGDDVLCLAPADEAVALAARLQQLFSAAWVVDTRPFANPWEWRRPGWDESFAPEVARGRFVIPLDRRDERGDPQPIRLNDASQPVAVHVADAGADTAAPSTRSVAGEVLPMLGAGASLSAGIAIGHYKTPLSVLLHRSKSLLDQAKASGRRAVGLGHASRGGEKTALCLPWILEDAGGGGVAPAIVASAIVASVAEGFRSGRLPGRLPYKLRQLAPSVRHGLEEIGELPEAEQPQARETLLDGLFLSCLEGEKLSREARHALLLWRRGIDAHPKEEDRYTDGLLFCRALGRGDQAGEAAE